MKNFARAIDRAVSECVIGDFNSLIKLAVDSAVLLKNFITALECLPWKKKKYRGPCECKRIPRRIRRLPINYCPPIVYLRAFAFALFSLCEIYIREKTFLAGVLDSRDISISTYRRVVDYRQHPVPDCRVYR